MKEVVFAPRFDPDRFEALCVDWYVGGLVLPEATAAAFIPLALLRRAELGTWLESLSPRSVTAAVVV